MTMEEVQQSILDDLSGLEDGLSRLEYLLLCAKAGAGLPEWEKREETLIPDCQTKAWAVFRWQDNRLELRTDSESLLIKGALELLSEIYRDRTREEVSQFQCTLPDEPVFGERLTEKQRQGLKRFLRGLCQSAA